jgi:hypothetical protein
MGNGGILSLCQHVQTGSGANSASCQMGPRGKAAGAQSLPFTSI